MGGNQEFTGFLAISPSLVGLSRARLNEGQLRRGRGRHFWPNFDKMFFQKHIFTLVPLRHHRRGGQLFYRRAGNITCFLKKKRGWGKTFPLFQAFALVGAFVKANREGVSVLEILRGPLACE